MWAKQLLRISLLQNDLKINHFCQDDRACAKISKALTLVSRGRWWALRLSKFVLILLAHKSTVLRINKLLKFEPKQYYFLIFIEILKNEQCLFCVVSQIVPTEVVLSFLMTKSCNLHGEWLSNAIINISYIFWPAFGCCSLQMLVKICYVHVFCMKNAEKGGKGKLNEGWNYWMLFLLNSVYVWMVSRVFSKGDFSNSILAVHF